jgi:hypothetical protein
LPLQFPWGAAAFAALFSFVPQLWFSLQFPWGAAAFAALFSFVPQLWLPLQFPWGAAAFAALFSFVPQLWFSLQFPWGAAFAALFSFVPQLWFSLQFPWRGFAMGCATAGAVGCIGSAVCALAIPVEKQSATPKAKIARKIIDTTSIRRF